MTNGSKAPARRIAALLVLAFAGFGCATPPQTRLLLDSPPDLPPRVELTEVPFFPQTEFHCGPAALATVIAYRGTAADPDAIANRVYVPGLKGSLQAEIVSAARQFDLLPVPLDGRLESIMREIDAGNPVFVLHNLGLDWLPTWHYEVVVGYDLERRRMIMRSGVHRRVVREFRTFERTWGRAGYWALALVPPDTIPASARERDFLDTVIAMEQVGRIDSAYRGYRAAARRWPDSLLAHSGAGNTAFALGDFAAAEAAYRAALALEPDRVEVWNNLAYALDRLGRKQDSGEAIRHALALDPDNPNLKASYRELVDRQ